MSKLVADNISDNEDDDHGNNHDNPRGQHKPPYSTVCRGVLAGVCLVSVFALVMLLSSARSFFPAAAVTLTADAGFGDRNRNNSYSLLGILSPGKNRSSSRSSLTGRHTDRKNEMKTVTTASGGAGDDEDDGDRVRGSCSCYNWTAADECCERVLRHFHKMGYQLTFQTFDSRGRKHQHETDTREMKFTRDGRSSAPQANQDYRDVLFVRNLYDALVSGYLYHKSGRECWLNSKGDPVQNGESFSKINRAAAWEALLQNSTNEKARVQLDPPNNGSSLCEYLAQVPEENGMRVFIVFYFQNWLERSVLANYEFANTMADRNRTLFLCYENLYSEDKQNATVQQVYSFLYPGDGSTKRREGHRRQLFEGGHSTDHDPELRARLREIVVRQDAQYFDHMVSRAQAKFRCGED